MALHCIALHCLFCAAGLCMPHGPAHAWLQSSRGRTSVGRSAVQRSAQSGPARPGPARPARLVRSAEFAIPDLPTEYCALTPITSVRCVRFVRNPCGPIGGAVGRRASSQRCAQGLRDIGQKAVGSMSEHELDNLFNTAQCARPAYAVEATATKATARPQRTSHPVHPVL